MALPWHGELRVPTGLWSQSRAAHHPLAPRRECLTSAGTHIPTASFLPGVLQALLRVDEKPESCQVRKQSSGRGGCKSNTHRAWKSPAELLRQKSRRTACEPGCSSPGAPSSAPLPHQAYLKLPACHWDQRQGLGREAGVSAGLLVKLIAGAKTSDLNLLFFSPTGILTRF